MHHTHTDLVRCGAWSGGPPFNNSPWIRFYSWLNLFIRVERLFFFCQGGCAWCGLILPPAWAQAGLWSAPVWWEISTDLIWHSGRPAAEPRRRAPPPSPPALVEADEIKRGEDGSVKCRETRRRKKLQWQRQLAGPWLDLRVHSISFYFPLTPSLWVFPSLPPCLIVHTHE